MLDHLAIGNGRRQACKKYSTQNTARMRKGKDQYGFKIFEERHKLDRDDKNGHHKKYRPKDNFWGILMLLPIQAPKTAAAGTSVDVGSFMYAALVGMQSPWTRREATRLCGQVYGSLHGSAGHYNYAGR